MRFVTTPVCTVEGIAVGPNGSRTIQPGENIAPGEVAYAGRRIWNNVLIDNLELEQGIKHVSVTIDHFTLHGIIPIYTKDGITECIYDYATIDETCKL